MKLLRYGSPGQEKPGILTADGEIRDLSGLISDLAGESLLPNSIERLRNTDLSPLPVVAGRPRIGPCVGSVGKFICIGLNYSDHAKEAGMAMPVEPVIFMKATSSICGSNDDVVIPRGSKKTDWEVELGVVIGKPGKYVNEAEAHSHVAGYCVINDFSERAFQAAVGGNLALVEEGDFIELDVESRRLYLDVLEDELERRRAEWQPPLNPNKMKGGYQQLYVERVMQANTGADLDFLTGCRGDEIPRESH
jgi:hypothetical protein